MLMVHANGVTPEAMRQHAASLRQPDPPPPELFDRESDGLLCGKMKWGNIPNEQTGHDKADG